MITTEVNGFSGSPSENVMQGPKIDRKKEYRYLDPVASVIGLAQIVALQSGQEPKISLGVGRLFPKSKSMATEQWVSTLFNAKALPNFVQSSFHSLDRTWNHDSREFLEFFNYAIPYVAMLYPTNSIEKEANKLMEKFWLYVLNGIGILEDSYQLELKTALIPLDKVERNETKFALPLENTIGETFLAWKVAIREYIKMKNDLERKSTAEIKEDKEKKISLLNPLLIEIQEKLHQFKERLKADINSLSVLKTLTALIRVVDLTLTIGSVPKKLYPLSEKVRKIWDFNSIQFAVKTIDDIKNCPIELNRESDLDRFSTYLNSKAIEYMKAVDKELDEVMIY